MFEGVNTVKIQVLNDIIAPKEKNIDSKQPKTIKYPEYDFVWFHLNCAIILSQFENFLKSINFFFFVSRT